MTFTLERFLSCEAQQERGATVARVESCQVCEDGKTAQILIELRDGRLVCFQFCEDQPITAHIIGRA